MPPKNPTDVILPMHIDPYIPQILAGTKTHDFRRFRLPPTVRRLWLYLVAPVSAIQYRLVVAPCKTRDTVLPETGLGNREFNTRAPSYRKYDYAYEIQEVWELDEPIPLGVMRERYGIKGAPRGALYVPEKMIAEVGDERWKRVR